MALPPFDIDSGVPADAALVSQFPALERLFRDVVESWFQLEHDATTGRHKFPTDTAANLAALSFPATGALRFNTDASVVQARFAGGWSVLDIQNGYTVPMRHGDGVAPIGWTKTDLSTHRYAIVLGTDDDGNDISDTDFMTVFTDRTIVQANLPNVSLSGSAASAGSHSHTGSTGSAGSHNHGGSTHFDGNHAHGGVIRLSGANGEPDVGTGGVDVTFSGSTDAAGNHNHGLDTDGSHTHSLSINSGGAHTHTVSVDLGGSGTTMDFNVSRLGFFIAAKNAPA